MNKDPARPALDAYLEQLRRLSEEAEATWLAWSQRVEDFARQQAQQAERWAEIARTIYEPDVSRFSEFLTELSAAAQSAVAPTLESLRKSFHELPPRLRTALLTLGEHGWYLDPQMALSEVWRLQEALEKGDIISAEARLCEYFEHELERIEAFARSLSE